LVWAITPATVVKIPGFLEEPGVFFKEQAAEICVIENTRA